MLMLQLVGNEPKPATRCQLVVLLLLLRFRSNSSRSPAGRGWLLCKERCRRLPS